ncbi:MULTISPECIES: alpha/beta hydrolase [unclassified Pseudofrankia]|uniref:alpha/beta hydrolase n=1 Tax=unclassified Pseudofrankia TaxID=2994372 RepID=UPI001F52090E|nr:MULTISPECIES: alpha/beta hydrolase [unclassified Pseudofrankia]MDT3438741.1 alpha/beta hydrolase [Pseudofrankia sp. BMG5.37]
MVLGLVACAGSSPSGGAATPAAAGSSASSVSAPRTVYDVAYAGTSPEQRLDLYLPAAAGRPAPLVIWIHGGGWRTGDKSSIADRYDPTVTPPKPTSCNDVVQVQVPDVAALTARGYAVASINYRLEQDPITAVQDAKAAVRYLRAGATRYRLDPDRFAAWGNSAGAYSAIMVGLTGGQRTVFDDPALGNSDVPATVQAVVDWYGPTDFASIPGHLGPAENPFTYIVAGRSLPPFRIANGDADCVVPVAQARRLYDALRTAGSVATLAVLPGAGHEDPAFMRTQLAPTVTFLARTFGQ